jgi:hypothetical protein
LLILSLLANLVRGLEETEYDRLPYDEIAIGTYDLEITGFQKPFEMPRPAKFRTADNSEMVTKTRLEFTVLNAPQQGATFYCMYTLALGDTANLGKLIRLATQTKIPQRWSLANVLGLTFRAYVRHSKDENGQIKTGKDGNPFPDVVLDTIEPLNSEPLPDALKSPTKKTITERTSDALAGRKDPMTAPNVSWTAFWAFAKSYGINDVKALDKTLKLDTGNLDVAETYALLAEKVGHEVTA